MVRECACLKTECYLSKKLDLLIMGRFFCLPTGSHSLCKSYAEKTMDQLYMLTYTFFYQSINLSYSSFFLTKMGDKLLCRIYIIQEPLEELIGDPLFHRRGILLHLLQTSAYAQEKNHQRDHKLLQTSCNIVVLALFQDPDGK